MGEIDLKFGVLGGDSITCGSGADILRDLTSIVNSINSQGKLVVKFTADQTSTQQLESTLNRFVSNQGVKKIKFDADTQLAEQTLKNLYNRWTPSGGGGNSGTGSVARSYSDLESHLKNIVSLRNQLSRTSDQGLQQSLRTEIALHQGAAAKIEQHIQANGGLTASDQRYIETMQRVSEYQAKINTQNAQADFSKTQEQLSSLESLVQKISSEGNMFDIQAKIGKMFGGKTITQPVTDAFSDLQAKISALNSKRQADGSYVFTKSDISNAQEVISAAETLRQTLVSASQESKNANPAKWNSLLAQVTQYYEKIKLALSANDPAKLRELETLMGTIRSGATKGGDFNAAVSGFGSLKAQISETGADVETLGQKIKRVFSEKFGYGVLAAFAMYARQALRQVYQNVVQIDDAMTQLSIVTGQTGSQLTDSFNRASDSAKKLGSSISDMLGSMQTFARLGYNMENSQMLADVATMMGNVADTSTSAATTGLTSIIKAWNFDPKQAEYVGDVLSNVGKKYAVSAEELMDALERSGAAFASTGTNFEKAVALITAGNAAVQNADAVGTALKTVSARIRGATTELDAMGESTDGVSKGISKYRNEIMSLTNVTGKGGFDIMADADVGQYKDIYDIFVGIAGVWDKLSDTSKARVSEILGGTRQLQVISSIMQNISDATGSYETALNSAGTLAADNATYLDSITGRLKTMKATFQEFSAALLDSDLVKVGVSFLTLILNLLTAITKTLGGLTVTGISTIIYALTKVKDLVNTIKSAGLIETIMKSGALGKIGLIIAAIGVVNRLIEAITGKDISGWVIEWSKTSEQKLGEIESKISDLNSKTKEYVSNIQNLSNAKTDIIPKYTELSKGVDSLGNNKTLSTDEYAEFHTLQNQIAEMFPEIDDGVDSNGNHILALSNNVDTLSESLQALVDKQIEVQQTNTANGFSDTITYIQDAEKEIQNLSDNTKDLKQETTDLYKGLLSGKGGESWMSGFSEEAFNALKVSPATNLATGYSENFNPNSVSDVEALKQNYNNAIAGFDKEIADYETRIKQEWDKANSTVVAILQTAPGFSDLGSSEQSLAEKLVSQLDLKDLYAKGYDTKESLQNYVRDNIISVFGPDGPLGNLDLSYLTNLFSDGTISAEEFSKRIKTAFSQLNEESPAAKAFIGVMQESGYSCDNLNEAIDAFIASMTYVPKVTEDSETNIDKLGEALSKTTTDAEDIKKVIDAMSKGKFASLSTDDFKGLLTALPELRSEILAYYNAVKSGKSPVEAQNKLLKQLQAAYDGFTTEHVVSGLKDVATAANTYGAQSYQAQHAVLAMSEYCPALAAALYDTSTGMYSLGNASEFTAQSILEVAKTNLSGTISTMKSQLASLEAQFWATAVSARGMALAMKISDLKQAVAQAQSELATLKPITIPAPSTSSSGGGTQKTQADKIKDAFDELNKSLEHSISLQKNYYDIAAKDPNSIKMTKSLEKQISYYKQIQAESHKSANQLRAYYKSQGMSAAKIEAQDNIIDLSNAWWEAENSISDTMDKMASDINKAFSDQVDDIQSVYDTLKDAAKEYSDYGYISVDTFQSILDMGVQYLSYLQDEDGQLVINEENIQKVIAARTEQLTVESALNYVEQLKLALQDNDTAKLNNLLTATSAATTGTWGLVYANLALLKLNSTQYQQALNNISNLRALSANAQANIGKSYDATRKSMSDMYDDQLDALDSILKMTEDMIKQEKEDQINALKDQDDAYQKIIEDKKQMLEDTKDENDYNKEVADKLKEMAKLQKQINLLSLDNSREASAKKADLEQQLADLQTDLSDYVGDYTLNKNEDTLDKEGDQYSEYIDGQTKAIEDSISSTEKLYRLAIDRIDNNMGNLYQQLIAYNYQYGDSLESELTKAWDSASEACQKYGSYAQAVTSITDAKNSSANSNVVGTALDNDTANTSLVNSYVLAMKQNSARWGTSDAAGKKELEAANKALAAQVSAILGQTLTISHGIWYIGGEKLYKLYPKYHDGGIVGGSGSNTQEETFAILKNRELVLNEGEQKTLFKIIDTVGNISSKLASGISSAGINYLNSIQKQMPQTGSSTDNSSMVFSPSISVSITHDGSMSNGDVRNYGQAIADITLQKLSEAFTKRGVKSLAGAALKG